MTDAPILIAGAGPTGLVLALGLARRGLAFRLISEAKGPGEHSRAMAVHARTLEFYRQFGFADAMVAQGVPSGAMRLREGGHEVAVADFTDLGEGISPYPFVLTFPQDDHERFLLARLEEADGAVEWGVRLEGLTQDAGGVRATLAHADGRLETCDAAWLCGCDGAHSQVRKTLGTPFAGAAYDQLFYVADVEIEGGFVRDVVFNLGDRILALLMPVRSTGMQRLIGLVPPELTDAPDLSFEDIRAPVEALAGVRVTAVNWFSHYRVHHRVAARFREGRVFLLGDAGHIHSPAGGQGMNTGIGDAVNLAWKLAAVVEGRADHAILDTYEAERLPFARTLVATTDRMFQTMVSGGAGGVLARRLMAPLALTVTTRFAPTRHAIFRTLSQTHIHYPKSSLSDGTAGRVRGGDRLPWTGSGGPDDFAPLTSLDWQAHVHGEPPEDLASACGALGLPLHVFELSDAARNAGFAPGALHLVRPDGYVALVAERDAAARLQAFASRFGLRFGVG